LARMSGHGQESQLRRSLEFVENSILDTLIPFSTAVKIEEALSGYIEGLDEGRDSPLSSVAQRQILFFGKSTYYKL
jgi:hypothetical protein